MRSGTRAVGTKPSSAAAGSAIMDRRARLVAGIDVR